MMQTSSVQLSLQFTVKKKILKFQRKLNTSFLDEANKYMVNFWYYFDFFHPIIPNSVYLLSLINVPWCTSSETT